MTTIDSQSGFSRMIKIASSFESKLSLAEDEDSKFKTKAEKRLKKAEKKLSKAQKKAAKAKLAIDDPDSFKLMKAEKKAKKAAKKAKKADAQAEIAIAKLAALVGG